MILSVCVFAQFPGAAGNGKSVPNMGHVFGKITDSIGKPVSDVSIVLLQSKFDSATKKKKDVLLKAMVTKANGEFSFEELPIMGMLKMKISGTGFVPQEQVVSFMPKMDPSAKPGTAPSGGVPSGGMPSFDKDLGKIKLVSDSKELAGVTVKSTAPSMRLDIDKKVFNVEKNIVSAGGTALDVMRNVPSVNVDIDGNVSVRNSAPTIFVDGRPTTLTLDQIPARCN